MRHERKRSSAKTPTKDLKRLPNYPGQIPQLLEEESDEHKSNSSIQDSPHSSSVQDSSHSSSVQDFPHSSSVQDSPHSSSVQDSSHSSSIQDSPHSSSGSSSSNSDFKLSVEESDDHKSDWSSHDSPISSKSHPASVSSPTLPLSDQANFVSASSNSLIPSSSSSNFVGLQHLFANHNSAQPAKKYFPEIQRPQSAQKQLLNDGAKSNNSPHLYDRHATADDSIQTVRHDSENIPPERYRPSVSSIRNLSQSTSVDNSQHSSVSSQLFPLEETFPDDSQFGSEMTQNSTTNTIDTAGHSLRGLLNKQLNDAKSLLNRSGQLLTGVLHAITNLEARVSNLEKKKDEEVSAKNPLKRNSTDMENGDSESESSRPKRLSRQRDCTDARTQVRKSLQFTSSTSTRK